MEIVWDIAPTFELSGISVRYYSVFFALAFILSYPILRWQILRGGGKERVADQMLLGGIFAAIVGGRLVHVLFYQFRDVWADPSILFSYQGMGLASHGSALGLVLWTAFVARKHRAPVLDVLDRLAPSGALAAALVRLGNLFNSEIVGSLTDQTWGIRFPYHDGLGGPLRHPSQLYEFGLGITVLGVLLVVDHRLGEKRPRGLLTALFLALYFSGRIVVEFWKARQALDPDSVVSMGQLLSLAPALLGWVGVYGSLRHKKPAGFEIIS